MRKYLICLALATFAFTVGIILFNGQSDQNSRQLTSKPNLRSNSPTDSTMQQKTSDTDSDDSGIIEGTTLDDNSSDEGSANPYEPVIADPSGWSDGSTDPVPETSPVVEESAGTPETETELIVEEVGPVPISGPEEPGVPVIEENNPSVPIIEENNGETIVEESGSVIPVEGPLDGSDSDSGVTPGIVVEAPAPSEGSDSGDVSGRGVIEVQPITEPEVKDPYGETEIQDPVGEGEVTEGEVIEVSLPTPLVNGGDEGNDSGIIEVTQPAVISDPAPIEVEVSAPVVNGGDEGNDSGTVEVAEPVIISEPAPTETEVVEPAVPETTD